MTVLEVVLAVCLLICLLFLAYTSRRLFSLSKEAAELDKAWRNAHQRTAAANARLRELGSE